MENNKINELVETCKESIELAKKMLDSCQRKRNKVHSDSRFIVSFFFSRSWEMFQSFLILIREGRFVDASLLLRSLSNMAIILAYITVSPQEKEVRAKKYIIKDYNDRLKLINKNYDELKPLSNKIDSKIDQLKLKIENLEDELRNKYSEKKLGFPSIKDCAKKSEPRVFRHYNLVYSLYSNVEHHSLLFQKEYVDSRRCEPKENLVPIKEFIFFQPEMILYYFNGLFLEILWRFNNEFRLNWEDRIENMLKTHENRYKLSQ